MNQYLRYIVVEDGDTTSFEEILKHDPAKLAESILEAEIYAKKLGYNAYTVYELSINAVKKVP